MKSLITLLTANTRERLNSKFISSFCISWTVFNFKGIAYFIFANVPIAVKLQTISDDYVSDSVSWIAPLLFTIFYVVGLPYIQIGFDKLTTTAVKSRYSSINQKEIDELDHQIKIAEKRIELNEKQNEFSTVKQLTRQLDEQYQEINDFKESEIQLKDSNKELLDAIKKLEEYIKQVDKKDISEEERNEYIKDYIKLKETNPNEYDIFIRMATLISKEEELDGIDHIDVERFKANNLIENSDTPNTKLFKFTKKGSVYWTQYVLSTSSRSENRVRESDKFRFSRLYKNDNFQENNINSRDYSAKKLLDEMTLDGKTMFLNYLSPELNLNFKDEKFNSIDIDGILNEFAMKNPKKFILEYQKMRNELSNNGHSI